MTDTGIAACPHFPFPRTSPLAPADEYERLRIEAPLIRVRDWSGGTPWLATRYADVRAILGDDRFSADHTLAGYPGPNESMTRVRERYPTFVTMDNPRHDEYRRLLTQEFMVRRVEGYRPMIRETITALVDAMLAAGGPTDYVQAVAMALPSNLICFLLGVPNEKQEYFQRLTRIMSSGESTAAQSDAASTEMCENLLRPLVRAKLAEPTDDLYGRLVERMRAGELSEDEVVALGRLLLVAGHDTTASMIGLSTLSVLLDDSLRERLRAHPETIPQIVEDLLRFWNIDNAGLRRVATEDVEIDGTTIHAGEGVILAIQSGDRDASVFSHADEIDPDRENLRAHMAFGYGIHQCLGQNLARVELQEILRIVFERVPDLRLDAALDELDFDVEMFNFGIESMPVRW